MSHNVFISYARLDQDYVLQLAQALKERGIPVWIDSWNIPVGADWSQAIDDAIRDCNRFLIVLSPAATVSEYAGEVGGELQFALNLQKEIASVLYQPCEIPRQLLRRQHIDLSSGLNETSVDMLARWCRGETPPEVRPSDRLEFIDRLHNFPKDDRTFDDEFSHTGVLELSKRLSDAQFKALRDLKALFDRYGYSAKGIVESLALERIGGPSWEAKRTFETLVQFGFLAFSADPRTRNDPDPVYNYTPLFFGYTNLQDHLGFGEPPKEPSEPPDIDTRIVETPTQVIMPGRVLRKRTPRG